MEIRALVPQDRQAWEPLWQGYLTFYKASLAPEVTDLSWARLHDPAEPMHGYGAFLDGRLAGITHLILHRSMWTIGPYCYLQDLFTAEDQRGRRVGRQLILAVYEAARAAGSSRVYWQTQATNEAGRALYDKVARHAGFIVYVHEL
jgi:GNAT superfamily N-acetyltransferase